MNMAFRRAETRRRSTKATKDKRDCFYWGFTCARLFFVGQVFDAVAASAGGRASGVGLGGKEDLEMGDKAVRRGQGCSRRGKTTA